MEGGLVGTVAEIWRYPVKSMGGELLPSCEVGGQGLLADRTYALVDDQQGMDGLVGSAKYPRRWPGLLEWRAFFTETPKVGLPPPPVRLVMPDGRVLADPGAHARHLSAFFGRPVCLSSRPPDRPMLQQFHTGAEGRAPGRLTREPMPAGTFFDLARINLLFSSTLDRLSGAHPGGRFTVARFRPNIVVTSPGAPGDLPEAGWAGKTLAIGNSLVIRVDSPCRRCVMTTLAQADLPQDPGILRTITRVNQGHAGLNATVVRPGVIQVGDAVKCLEWGMSY